ncbi:MAG TPA: 5-carboxymethyl-2-hydroxymuconate Delta-isomerase [Thermoanaerobaculia bacterium]|nr:5-carboxymethyl-2-hydroxymuconate Delta-isomerase [Thermoanaerobaculia bacterium]
MPHCILEYSANLPESPDFQALFRELHEVLVASGEFKLEDIKSRAVRHEVFRIGDGDPKRTFVAMNLCLLSGRSDEVKAGLARSILELLKRAFARTLAETACSLSVQVSELHRPSYQKVLGPVDRSQE